MKDVKFKGISFVRYLFIYRFLRVLNYRFNPFSSRILVWGNRSQFKKKQVVCIEDGFIRSVGLGVHFNQPLSLVFDSTGIYYDATCPSDLENILNYTQFNGAICTRAKNICNALIKLGISKYNVGDELNFSLPLDKAIVLVPGQVESDASIRFGSPKVKTNLDLLRVVRASNPDAYIIYKPHPDVISGQRDKGKWKFESMDLADLVITDVAIDKVLGVIDEVHTITSLAGFEALLRGKKVTTYGLPFYAGWGLTTDMEVSERRKRLLTLEELIAGTLILYPTYLDPYTHDECTVERAIQIVHSQRSLKSGRITLLQQLLLCLKKIKEKLSSL